jgi:hypothetical protein
LSAALQAEIRRAERDRWQLDGRPDHRANLDPIQRPASVRPLGQQRHDRLGRRRAPQVIQDDVDVGGRFTERLPRPVVGQRHDRVGVRQGVEPSWVASGSDHPAGAEPFGDLDRHGAGVSGRAEDEHALAGLDRHSPPERHPRRHRRIHRGCDLDDVDVVGQLRACNPNWTRSTA